MLNGKTVAVVIPTFNEEKQIGNVIKTMPDFVDRIVVVNDKSKDRTAKIVTSLLKKGKNNGNVIQKTVIKIPENKYNRAERVANEILVNELRLYTPFEILNRDPDRDRLILINHKRNAGVGAAISSGYRFCRDREIDCVAVMAGDGQMDPDELKSICLPVVNGQVDYVKGNRLTHRSALFVVPKIRYFGNSILSLLTKVASGYWHVSDTQCGYTAISLAALRAIRIHAIYPSYGYPNSLLVKLNIAFCTIKEVKIKPVYNVGEESKMNITRIMPALTWLLIKSFFYRLYAKYLFRDFHPLFLFYSFSILLIIIDIPVSLHLYDLFFVTKRLPVQSLVIFTFLTISAFQSLFFAMWMDMQDNERLQKI